MEFYSTIFKTYDMMILDSVFPLFFFLMPKVLCYNYNLFSLYMSKNFSVWVRLNWQEKKEYIQSNIAFKAVEFVATQRKILTYGIGGQQGDPTGSCNGRQKLFSVTLL